MAGLEIKELTESQQVDELLPLFEAYRAFYRKTPNRQSRSFLIERIQSEDAAVFLACVDGQPVGFVQLFKTFSSTRLRPLWILNDLYTKEEFRNQSIGAYLIEKSKELAKETDACGLMLETEKSNDPGNHLYPAAGFKLMDKVNHYFWINTASE